MTKVRKKLKSKHTTLINLNTFIKRLIPPQNDLYRADTTISTRCISMSKSVANAYSITQIKPVLH